MDEKKECYFFFKFKIKKRRFEKVKQKQKQKQKTWGQGLRKMEIKKKNTKYMRLEIKETGNSKIQKN